jgi:hypothetical protein
MIWRASPRAVRYAVSATARNRARCSRVSGSRKRRSNALVSQRLRTRATCPRHSGRGFRRLLKKVLGIGSWLTLLRGGGRRRPAFSDDLWCDYPANGPAATFSFLQADEPRVFDQDHLVRSVSAEQEGGQAREMGKVADEQHVVCLQCQPVRPDLWCRLGIEAILFGNRDGREVLSPRLRRLPGSKFSAVNDARDPYARVFHGVPGDLLSLGPAPAS